MKDQKKYCLNVSSYKYKRECMKLFSTTLKAFSTYNNNEIIESQNLCPGGKRCKNYGIILNLEQKIKALNDTVNQLTKINEYSNESNLKKNFTPTKSLEPKRHDSFNEFCNSFRNSIKKKKFRENNRSLTGSVTFPQQISEPYRIKPYNSISTETKIPNRKIMNKKHINLDLNNIKNYKNKFYNNSEKNDVNEEFFLNKKENINIEQKRIEDNFDNNKNKIDEENNKFQKLYSSISEYYNNKGTDIDKDKSNKSINDNINNIDNDEKNNLKKQKNGEKEKDIKNKNEYNENINQKNNIKDNDKIKNKSLNLNYSKETKKTIDNVNLPIVKKIKTYKLIIPLKADKNKRYVYELYENKVNIRDENKNKLFFRKFKGKINNSFNASNNQFLSRSSGIRNNTEGNERLLNLNSKNSKTLSYQNRFNKIKINSFNNFRPLSLTQKPFKIKMSINQNDLFRNKNKNNDKIKYDNYNDIDSNCSNSFVKDLEFKYDENEGKNDKTKIFNEIYSLALSKKDEIIEKIKNLSIEKIGKYSAFIINSLKYIKDSAEIMHKLKIFYNFINNSKNKNNNNDNKKEILINDEFINYREKAIKLLNCEKIHIFIYDPVLECLILKGEKEEKRFEKDRDLIGLSFTSGKKVRYEADNNSPIPLPKLLGDNTLNKIKNLLLYPLKDSNNKIYGISEAINKIQDKDKDNNNLYNNNFYFEEKISFNKNDEIIISFISKDLGNFCRYYNYIKNNNIYLDYYHKLYIFSQNLFLKNNSGKENNIIYFINEVIDISKKIFDMADILFLICSKDHFYDIQKNKKVPFEGLVYKCYKERKIIYICKPLINNFYSNKSDLTINIFNTNKNEELITIPILEINRNEVIMIIQIKTNKKFGDYLSLENDKLSEEIIFVIENIEFIIQKYLSENIELVQTCK